MDSAQCTTAEKVRVNVTAHAGSKDVPVDGSITVTVNSGSGSAEQIPDAPMSYFAVSGDTPGETEYKVVVDADLGAGVKNIETAFLLVVVDPQADNLTQSADAPVAK